MKLRILLILTTSSLLVSTACEKKTEPAPAPAEGQPVAEQRPTPKHKFKAAAKAARDIEGKQVDRNASADEAMNAGK
jgi:hypothetical protein